MDQISAASTAIDFDHLSRQAFSDRTLERELLELFERQCGVLLPVIADAHPPDVRLAAAHTLKGSARAVGAWTLATLVERAESLINNGEADGVSTLINELADAVRAAQAAAVRRRAAD